MAMKKKNPVLCYIHFMYNEWNPLQAKKVFADAPCGWQYLWDKWVEYLNNYGYHAAMMMYFAEGLDSKLQETISNYANDYYNGK